MALSRVFELQKPKPNCMIASGVSSRDIDIALYEIEIDACPRINFAGVY